MKRWYPDDLSLAVGSSLREDIAWQTRDHHRRVSRLLVIHALIARELAKRPELYYSPVRRWLTYVALVLSAVTIVIDGAATIEALILGHLTAHFILDTLGLLVIGGTLRTIC